MTRTTLSVCIRLRTNLIAARERRGLTQREVNDQLNLLIAGRVAFSTYRQLEASASYSPDSHALPGWSQAMVDALAYSLGIPRTDLATDDDYNSLPVLPHKKKDTFRLVAELGDPKIKLRPDPAMIILRLQAYRQRDHKSIRDIARSMHMDKGTEWVTDQNLAKIFKGDRSYDDRINGYFVENAANALASNLFGFNPQRLISCTVAPCPHCHPYLKTV